MIDLLLVCVLALGQEFIPPEGWQVVKVSPATMYAFTWSYAPGVSRDTPTRVTIRREAKPGDVVSAPAGCALATVAPSSGSGAVILQ